MSEEPYSKRELDTHFKNLEDQITTGFKGVHNRQDVTNGKVLKSQSEIELLKQQDIIIHNQIAEFKKEGEDFMRDEKNKENIWKTRLWDLITRFIIPFVAFLLVYWLTAQGK